MIFDTGCPIYITNQGHRLRNIRPAKPEDKVLAGKGLLNIVCYKDMPITIQGQKGPEEFIFANTVYIPEMYINITLSLLFKKAGIYLDNEKNVLYWGKQREMVARLTERFD